MQDSFTWLPVRRDMKKNLLNLVLFQIGWLVCVLGGNLYAMAYTVGALAIHQWRVFEYNHEWRLIAGLTLAGCLWDILLAANGVMRYPGAEALGIPLWLICLWSLFATTLPVSRLDPSGLPTPPIATCPSTHKFATPPRWTLPTWPMQQRPIRPTGVSSKKYARGESRLITLKSISDTDYTSA